MRWHLLCGHRWLSYAALVMLVVSCRPSPTAAPTILPASSGALTPTRVPTVGTAVAPTRVTTTPVATPAVPLATETTAASPTAPLNASPTAPTAPLAGACQPGEGKLSIAYLNSIVLARRVPYSLYLPPCYGSDPARRYPVLYLLHGANTDHTQWPDLNVLPDADALIDHGTVRPFLVVMPDGDYRAGEDYGAFVLRDLIPHVEQTYQVAGDRKDRAIGGLSQGGYWALNLAFSHPDLFDAVGGHSPATDSTLVALLSANSADLSALRIYIDVGNEDPLMYEVSSFAAVLRSHGLAPIFHVYPGAHNRPYWRSHTTEYLMFYAENWK